MSARPGKGRDHAATGPKRSRADLKRVRHVGDVTARRLLHAGICSAADLASTGENRLAAIDGIRPHLVREIIRHARKLAASDAAMRRDRDASFDEACASLASALDAFVSNTAARASDPPLRTLERRFSKQCCRLAYRIARLASPASDDRLPTIEAVVTARTMLAALRGDDLAGAAVGLKDIRHALEAHLLPMR